MLAVVAAAILWSSGGLLIKLVNLNAFQISSARSFFAAIFFLFFFKKKALYFNKPVFVNALIYCAILILFVLATKTTTAANAIFLQYTAPIYVFIFEPLLLKTRFERINLITILICFLGMSLFFMGEISPGHFAGNIYALLSGISFAAFLLGMRKINPEYQFASIFYGNVCVFLTSGFSYFSYPQISGNDLLMLLLLGIFQIGLAYAFFSYGIKIISAIEVSIISMIEPILNPVWVLIGYGERPSTYAIIGGIVVVCGLLFRTLLVDFFFKKHIRKRE